jgi:CobQ-like glutamine amidotransferase family enzyme
MDNVVLKTAFLYPDIFCLNGDRGNISALLRTSDRLGVKMMVDRINSPDSAINFDTYDIFYIPSGELRYIISTAQALNKQYSSIKKAIDAGKIFLITGTSVALFADKIVRADKSDYSALGIGNFDCIERTDVYGNDLVFDTQIFDGYIRITGCQISLINTVLKEGAKALGEVVYGYGNNGGADEGIIFNNCILTNALGPVLIKNPLLTVAIIKQALKTKILI